MGQAYCPEKGFLLPSRKTQTFIKIRLAASNAVKVHFLSIREPLDLVDTIDLSLKSGRPIGIEPRFYRLYYAGFERIELIPFTKQEPHRRNLPLVVHTLFRATKKNRRPI